MATEDKAAREINGPPGSTIYRLRKSHDWSLRTLAKKSGVHHTTVRRYELNESYQQHGLEKVAAALGVGINVLFYPPEVAEVFTLPAHAQARALELLHLYVTTYKSGDETFLPGDR